MTIITPVFNSENYVEKTIRSIMNQSYKDFKCYITDDLSTDNTVNIIKKNISTDDRFVLIENKNKKYPVGNIDFVIRHNNLNNDEICIEIDGDDWLPDENVFHRIHEVYQDENIWMTTGSYLFPGNQGNSYLPPPSYDNVRKDSFFLSHLRTWRSWLWKMIKEEDLKDDDGEYWKVAGDCAFMFPMFEMSGKKHYKYLPEVNYIYNNDNPLSDFRINAQLVFDITQKIRNKTEYTKIS